MNVGGEDLRKNLLQMIKDNIDPNYKLLKGRILVDEILDCSLQGKRFPY